MSRKNFNTQIKSYLLTVLADEDHGINNPTDKDLISYTKNRFYSEYGYMIPRVGVQNAIKEWLLGLAISVDYSYYDIGLRLISWGVISDKIPENKRDKELDLYWVRLASNLRQMFDKVED